MTIALSDFDFGAIDSGIVLETQHKTSAFQKLGQKVALPATGAVVSFVENITSSLVLEGGVKPVSGNGGKFVVGSNKFASIVVETKEAWDYSTQIADVVFTTQPKAHATAFDAYIAGTRFIPVEFTNFVSLTNTPNTVEIGTGDAASVALDDAIASVASGDANGIVLSTGMLSYLNRQRVGATGSRVFEIIRNAEGGGTIDGLPFELFKSVTPVGYVGDFSRFYWGADETVDYRVAQDGIVVDSQSVSHNLTQENKVALINEIRQGANVATLEDFVKITPVV